MTEEILSALRKEADRMNGTIFKQEKHKIAEDYFKMAQNLSFRQEQLRWEYLKNAILLNPSFTLAYDELIKGPNNQIQQKKAFIEELFRL